MIKLFSKKISNIDKVLNELIKKYNSPEVSCLVLFHRKDKKIIPLCKTIKDETIKINEIYYYTDSKRIFETQVTKGNKCYNIPVVTIYEGVTVSFTPYEEINSREFSEVFQDMISLNIERGILENKRRKQVNMRKMIAIVLITIAGIFIGYKMLTG
jgi:hypothetical protein